MAQDQASVALAGSVSRLIRRWGDFSSVVLSFKPTGTGVPGELVAAMHAAVEAANATAEPEVLAGGAAAAGVGGPSVVVSWDGVTATAIQPWLNGLAVALSKAGYAGTIQPAPIRHFDWPRLLESPYRVVPTLVAGYQVTHYPVTEAGLRRFGTTPGNRFYRTAGHLAAWGAELTDAPRNIGVSTAGNNEVTDLNLTDWITSAAALVNGSSHLCYYHRDQRTMRRLRMARQGQLVVQENHATRPWPELVAQARNHLLVDPVALDVAQIRNGLTYTLFDWDTLRYSGKSSGHQPLHQGLFLHARHLWQERVYDAAAIQLLTGAHLAHATNLDRWQVTEVAPDRYLVEATDLNPWFAQDTPDPHVLQQARDDFGDMILTEDHERTTPGPYTHPRLRTGQS